jgi:hypothetical protein
MRSSRRSLADDVVVTTHTAPRNPANDQERALPRPRRHPSAPYLAVYPTAGDMERLAYLTADALEAAVEAALAGDRVAARRVLRRAGVRKAARAAADARVRRGLAQCPPRTGNLGAVASTLQFIAELGHIGDLVDTLARNTVVGDLRCPVPQVLRRDVMTVGRAGAQRIRQLAEGLPSPAMDAGYLRTGRELRAVVDHVDGLAGGGHAASGRGRATAATASGALAEAVLVASRHAARVA